MAPTRSHLTYAGFGILATLVGMAAGHLVASLIDPASSPVLAVGSTVIDLTPDPGQGVGGRRRSAPPTSRSWSARCCSARWCSPRSPASWPAAGSPLGALRAGAAGRRRRCCRGRCGPAPDPLDAVPALATAVAGVGALWWLTRAAADAAPAPPQRTGRRPEPPRGAGRRRRARRGSGGDGRGRPAGHRAPRRPERRRAARPPPTRRRRSRRASTARSPGISPFRTPNDDFYRVDTRLSLPVVDVDDYTLTIDGDVDQEVTFTFDDLARDAR